MDQANSLGYELAGALHGPAFLRPFEPFFGWVERKVPSPLSGGAGSQQSAATL